MDKVKLNRQSRRLFELMHQSHEAELNEKETLELNSLLKESEELRLIFLSMRDQHISLDERLKNRRTNDQVLGFDDSPQEPKESSKFFLKLLLIISLLAAGFAIGSLKSNHSSEKIEPTLEDVPSQFEYHIATISSSINTFDSRLKKGQDLKAGWLTLKKGKIILEMSSGMEISVEAPAKIELIDSSSLKLDYGKIRLKSSLARKGFSIITKHGKLSDQGADFGVHIEESIATSNCFTGEVAFIDGELVQMIHAGQNYSLKDKKFIAQETYKSTESVRAEAQLASKEKLAAWRRYIHQLKYDPDTAFLYQFAPNINNPQELIQEVHRSEVEPAHGKIIGANWDQGRFPGTSSLKFDSPNDRVKFFLNEKFDTMTYHMWVKIDELNKNNNHLGIFLSEKWDPNQITLQYVTLPKGAFFKVDSRENFVHNSIFLKPEQILGQWLLISFTFNIEAKEIHLYLNGKSIDKQSKIHQQSMTPPFIGWCDLMNWVPLNSQDIRSTPGQVDFLSIHRRAFSAEEVLDFYNKSKTP